MDKKSKIVIFILFLAIACSVAVLYQRYIIQKDFDIIQNPDGIPVEVE